MTSINSLSAGQSGGLQISRVEDDARPTPVTRERQLVQQLGERLSSELNRIRARLAGTGLGDSASPNLPHTGQKLDISA